MEQGTRTRCACGTYMRPARAARVGMCARCEGVTDGRQASRARYGAYAITTDAEAAHRYADADARSVYGARYVYGADDARCEHRGVCRHAPTTARGIALAWCARCDGYHYTPLHRSERIPRMHTRVHMRWSMRATVSLRVCELCDAPYRDHANADHAYRATHGAIAGDVRTFHTDDVDGYVRAFRSRCAPVRYTHTQHDGRNGTSHAGAGATYATITPDGATHAPARKG